MYVPNHVCAHTHIVISHHYIVISHHVYTNSKIVKIEDYTGGILNNTYSSVVRQFGIMWFSFWLPCLEAQKIGLPWDARKKRKSRANSFKYASEKLSDFGMLLASNSGRVYFQRHLVCEFSVENMLFWKR